MIRPYDDERDRETVIALWNDVFSYATGHNDPAASIDRKRAAGEDGLFLVATDVEGTAVGTVMGGYDGHRGWIYSLAVRPDERGRRIGSQLVGELEARLVELGAPKINLQIVADNAGVVAFYESLGYAVEERISMGKKTGRP